MGALPYHAWRLDRFTRRPLDSFWSVRHPRRHWFPARRSWSERRFAGFLPLPDGLHGHCCNDSNRLHGGTLEVRWLCADGTLGQHVYLPTSGGLDLGRWLVTEPRSQHRPWQRCRGFCWFWRGAHDWRSDRFGWSSGAWSTYW